MTGQGMADVFFDIHRDSPREAKDFWEGEYPQMQDIAQNLSDLRSAGYRAVGHFTLPESAWWDYYRPLERRVLRLKET